MQCSDNATKFSFEAEPGDPFDDFSQRVLEFLRMQQQLQHRRSQCLQDSIFYISVMEAAIFLQNVAILSAFLILCCLVPWRLPAILQLVCKSNDTINMFQALNAHRLLSLVAAQRPDMISVSVQRMHTNIRKNEIKNSIRNLREHVSHVIGSGRVQSVYEQLLSHVCRLLSKTDAESSDLALTLVKAHDDSMRLLQLHALYYVHTLHELTIAALRSAEAKNSSNVSRGILLALARSRTKSGLAVTQPSPLKSSELVSIDMLTFPAGSRQQAFTIPSHALNREELFPEYDASASDGSVVEPSRSSGNGTVQFEEECSLDPVGTVACQHPALDDASLHHIDLQARVATIVASHFLQSEALFATAMKSLRARELQIQVSGHDTFTNVLQLTLNRKNIRHQNGF
jgi:hypothetical protein